MGATRRDAPFPSKERGIREGKKMRKFIFTFLPAPLLLACLTMVLSTCGGGGGGGGGGAPPATLSGLSINGPSSVSEYGTGTYTATASWSDNSTSTVKSTWSVNSKAASISTGGVLSCLQIDNDQAVTVTATYSSGGITETATMDVGLTNIVTVPFTAQMLSGNAFFEENTSAGGGYDSNLTIFNADFSFKQYSYEKPPGTSDNVTGTWSIDASGKLLVNISGQGTITAELISDSSTQIQVVFDDGIEPPSIATLEKIVPVDPVKLSGTYVGSDGYTWVFNTNGTGSVSGFGGITFTWSVDSDGVLRMPSNPGYTAVFYARASSQSTATSYTILKAGFPEFKTSTGEFYTYYGGIELTRK
ncbi:hypothetical protein NBG4_830002 [Candidatus Sulfobium mesophilum]|uniref:BIG2 domain-containing protein n=1 Tax=Candidatus Sulfobium mesophilum TaxID=2016548 RepID=A0A2U3QKV2_9BACT|nr:hypothetical protein NBG4_830002 [Candidatus Sulfobium mesophilum]